MKKCSYCGYLMNDDAIYCPACGQKFRHIASQSDYDYIHDYLQRACDIEYYYYELTTLDDYLRSRYHEILAQRQYFLDCYNDLRAQSDQLYLDRQAVHIPFSFGAAVRNALIWALVVFGLILLIGFFKLDFLMLPFELLESVTSIYVVMLILLVILPLVIGFYQETGQNRYENHQAMAAINTRISEAESGMAQILAQIHELDDHTIPYHQRRASRCDEIVNMYDDYRQRYYNLDRFYVNYRSIIPVTTLYNYIDSRRCTHLEGDGGAYDKFENDLGHRLITNNLSELLQSPGQFSTSQQALSDRLNLMHDFIEDSLNNNTLTTSDIAPVLNANLEDYYQSLIAYIQNHIEAINSQEGHLI